MAPEMLLYGVQYSDLTESLRVTFSRDNRATLVPANIFCRVLKGRPCLPTRAAPADPNFLLSCKYFF